MPFCCEQLPTGLEVCPCYFENVISVSRNEPNQWRKTVIPSVSNSVGSSLYSQWVAVTGRIRWKPGLHQAPRTQRLDWGALDMLADLRYCSVLNMGPLRVRDNVQRSQRSLCSTEASARSRLMAALGHDDSRWGTMMTQNVSFLRCFCDAQKPH